MGLAVRAELADDSLSPRQRAFDRVERITDLPMIVLSLAIIPLVFIPLFVDLSTNTERAFLTADFVIWGVFALELVVKTYLAPRRGRYLIENWFDVVIVVLPFLRPLRVVRSLRAMRLLRVLRATSLFVKVLANGRQVFSRYGLHYGLAIGLFLVVGCAALVFYFERSAGGSIDDFGTALWWAATTVTTVGYGDTYPTTPEGRGLAVFLMLIGITLFGLLTASIAAFFVESDKSGPTLSEVMSKLEDIERRLDAAAAIERPDSLPTIGVRDTHEG